VSGHRLQLLNAEVLVLVLVRRVLVLVLVRVLAAEHP
jgi:hypothetical protein